MHVTIFLRVRNNAQTLEACLEAVFAQDSPYSFEVLVLDFGSSDRSMEICGRFNLHMFRIPFESYTPASAINFGVSRARGKLFVSLAPDAIPEGKNWLAELVHPLVETVEVGATYSRQLPSPESSIPERLELGKRFRSKRDELDTDRFVATVVEGVEPFDATEFSIFSFCVRRELLEMIPFNEVPSGEDRAFAVDCLLGGFSIRYVPESKVVRRDVPSFARNRSRKISEVLARAYTNANCLRRLQLPANRPVRFPAMMTLRIPGEIVAALVRAIVIMALPFRPNRLREISFQISRLGDLIGWRDGWFELDKHGHVGALRRADAGTLLAKAEELQRPQRTRAPITARFQEGDDTTLEEDEYDG